MPTNREWIVREITAIQNISKRLVNSHVLDEQ